MPPAAEEKVAAEEEVVAMEEVTAVDEHAAVEERAAVEELTVVEELSAEELAAVELASEEHADVEELAAEELAVVEDLDPVEDLDAMEDPRHGGVPSWEEASGLMGLSSGTAGTWPSSSWPFRCPALGPHCLWMALDGSLARFFQQPWSCPSSCLSSHRNQHGLSSSDSWVALW